MEHLKIDLTKFLDNKAIVYYENEEKCNIVKYKDLLKLVLKVGLILEQEDVSRNESTVIGIYCEKSPATIALSLAIIESGFGFCSLTKEDISHDLDDLGCKYFFSDLQCSLNFAVRSSFELFGKNFRLYKTSSANPVKIFDTSEDKLNRICYTVTTSGSTGKRKIVRVPFNCIIPNIVNLQQIFQLNNDVIFASAPCTFDVFVLDMILALQSGSELLILNDTIRYSKKAVDLLSNSVTFVQITPSLFVNYGIEIIQNKILHANSSLRCLVLGGEKFPTAKDVLKWQDWNSDNRKRIFNIYGITEMSCWAMIHEVTREDLIEGKVPLGRLLSDTHLGFACEIYKNPEDEQLVLMSANRFCYVDDKNIDNQIQKDFIAYRTGDIVRRENGKIFYYGRRDEMIKKFGGRVSLSKIEAIASAIIQEVSCVYTKKRIVLFCKTEDENEIENLKVYLRNNLNSMEVPDQVLKISFFPLSKHGKVDKHQLKLIFKDLLREDRENQTRIEETFLEAINQIFNLKIHNSSIANNGSDEPDGKRKKTELDLSFRALGGSSFDALRISMRLDDIFGMSNVILPKLLSDHESIRDICSYLKNLQLKTQRKLDKSQFSTKSKLTSKIIASFNMKKCIDASPSASEDFKFLSVGSHSHEVVTLDLEKLQIKSKTMVIDRIESEVSFKGNLGFVGCYDGFLYCFDLQTGEIGWKFDTQGKIKSKAVIFGDTLFIGNYNHDANLWCLQLNESNEPPTVKWKRIVGENRGILATPLVIEDSKIFICALDGTMEMIDFHGNLIWRRKFDFPIFSTPQKVPQRNEILIGEVANSLHCVDFDGNEIWRFHTDGEIFSSFSFHNIDEFNVGIIFGCHDKKLRYLNYNFEEKSINLKWICELQSQIFATPKLTNDGNLIISCSTSGFVNFINTSTGDIEHCHKLPGEVFSTPFILDRKIFLGCRNNFLYCIEF